MVCTGTVHGGSARAGALGYPTANIPLTVNAAGSYVAQAMVDGKAYQALAYADPDRDVLEVHLFDFSGNLYGKELAVTLEKKLREREHFANEALLREAIDNDAKAARDYFHT